MISQLDIYVSAIGLDNYTYTGWAPDLYRCLGPLFPLFPMLHFFLVISIVLKTCSCAKEILSTEKNKQTNQKNTN